MPRLCRLSFLFLAGKLEDSLMSWAALDFSFIVHLWKLTHVVIIFVNWKVIWPWSIYCYNFFFHAGCGPGIYNGVACRILKFLMISSNGVLPGILSGGVPTGSPNPDPISDQKNVFSTPVFRPDLENPYQFLNLAFRQKLCYHYLDYN